FAAYTTVTDDQENTGDAVTALFFDDMAVGSALLQECARRSQRLTLAFPASHGMSPVRVYNAGWNGLSDHLALVGRVLALAGFTPYYREMSMICDLAASEHMPVDVPGIGIQFVLEEDGSFRQQAIDGEQKSGVCSYYLLSGYTDDPRGARIGYVDGLWVPERARRHGIGRALMLHALAHLHALGCTECWLTTGADNWPAQPLYLALGFAFVDCSASFKRT
ncbi:MAG TPA: GNAT family N-acetyltransferase, partial [Roseiflexaceae bacterium]|nr:GNAT family N-acetyltransferase [Roseiflexaceae bacterium]